MRIPRFAINMMANKIVKQNYNIYKDQFIDPRFKPRFDIKYLDDDNYYHGFDVYYADENSRNICVIDIHGGSFMFGDRKENYQFGTVFLNAGFDFIAVDYQANRDGNVDVRNMVGDLIKCFEYIFSHLKELNLENRRFVITGDSAGGYFALLISMMLQDGEYAKLLDANFPKVDVIATLVNCTVYDFTNLGKGMMSKAATKRMFGPHAMDIEARKLISPSEHVESLKGPLFASTCRHDFIRAESLKLISDYEKRDNVFEFIDLDAKDKEVAHVHNILNLKLKESIIINEAMIKFILKNA